MTDAVKKYESVPKRKEMISDSMFHYIAKLASRSATDSLIRTMVDWIILGCYTGFQKLEWCSDHHDSFDTIDDPNWGDRPMSLPFITSDFSFATESGRRIQDPASSPDGDIAFITLCFRKQKNNDNGQTLTYHRQPDSGCMCPTQASLNIVRRALHLNTPIDQIPLPSTLIWPLASASRSRPLRWLRSYGMSPTRSSAYRPATKTS